MARIRTIKPTFFMNDELADLDPLTRLLYVGLWTQADREGRMEDRPKRIKANVLPYDSCDVDAMLGALHESGHITRYEVAGSRFIQVVNFTKHQAPNIKEQPSTIPAPDEHSTSTVQECQERKEGREGKGRDARAEEIQDGKPMTSTPYPSCLNADIEVIDPAYTGSCWGFIVGQAEAQFGNLLSHAERTEIAEAITRGCIPGCDGSHPQGCAVHVYDKLKLKGATGYRGSRLWRKCLLEDRMEVRQ